MNLKQTLKDFYAQSLTERSFIKNKEFMILFLIVSSVSLIFPEFAHASLEASLNGIKSKLTGVILPLLSVIGIAIAGISFFSGNPNAKQHIAYAIIGSMIGFGAQSIVDFISQTVR